MGALLAAGARASQRNASGSTALMAAAEGGWVGALQLLLLQARDNDSGAVGVNRQQDDGDTALFVAAEQGHTAVVEALLASRAATGLALDLPDHDRLTPLMAAAYFGNTECVAALVIAGADKALKCDEGNTVYDWALERGHHAVLEALQRTPGQLLHRRRSTRGVT